MYVLIKFEVSELDMALSGKFFKRKHAKYEENIPLKSNYQNTFDRNSPKVGL